MKAVSTFMFAMALAMPTAPAAAQEPAPQPRPQVCVVIDETRDTFSPGDRRAALLLVARQFELAGKQVVTDACPERFSLTHIRLGNTITVILAGPAGERQTTASSMEDLPAVYSQMVRAILTGRDVGSMRVVDRTNVTDTQASPKRVEIDSFGYARLGYGAVLGEGGSSSPAMGFGYRAELDSFGFDVSFLNEQLPSSSGGYGSSSGMSGSLLKLEGLYFVRPRDNATAYFGGGLSWGVTALSTSASSNSYSSWSGSGLQGELTAGYELPRASALRFFVQADAALPFYRVAGRTYTYSRGQSATVITAHRYTPSIVLSVGMGWQRHHR